LLVPKKDKINPIKITTAEDNAILAIMKSLPPLNPNFLMKKTKIIQDMSI